MSQANPKPVAGTTGNSGTVPAPTAAAAIGTTAPGAVVAPSTAYPGQAMLAAPSAPPIF